MFLRLLSTWTKDGQKGLGPVHGCDQRANVPVFLPDRWVVLAGSVSLLTQQLVHQVPSTGGRASIAKLLFFVAAFQFYPLLFLCVLTNSRH